MDDSLEGEVESRGSSTIFYRIINTADHKLYHLPLSEKYQNYCDFIFVVCNYPTPRCDDQLLPAFWLLIRRAKEVVYYPLLFLQLCFYNATEVEFILNKQFKL